MELGTVLFRLSDPFNVHHFRRVCHTWGRRNHGPQHPGSPPTLGTSAAPTGTTPATRTSSPASRPSAAILATHVTGGGRGRAGLRVRKGRGSRLCPQTWPSQKPRPPSWLWLGAVSGGAHWPRGGPGARGSAPRQALIPGFCYLWAWLPVLASRGKRGMVLTNVVARVSPQDTSVSCARAARPSRLQGALPSGPGQHKAASRASPPRAPNRPLEQPRVAPPHSRQRLLQSLVPSHAIRSPRLGRGQREICPSTPPRRPLARRCFEVGWGGALLGPGPVLCTFSAPAVSPRPATPDPPVSAF